MAASLVKRYDYLVKSRGQTINIPNISNAFTARVKTQGSDVTDDVTTETQTQIQVNKWYYNSFIIEDIVAVQSQYDLRKEYSEKAGLKILVPLTGNCYRKLGEFGETLKKETIPSRASKEEGVTTMYPISFRDKDIVCSA